MARFFRLWEKKRGERRTGSQLVGRLGEALFFGSLFLLGLASLSSLLISQVMHPTPELYRPGFGFWLTVLVLTCFVVIGGVGMIYAVMQVASAERRSALARRAADIDLLSEALPSMREFPTVPRDTDLRNSPGVRLAFRLPIAQSQAWKLTLSTIFCLAWNGVAAVLLVLVVESFLASRPDWQLTIVLLPILAVGAWTVYYFIQQMLIHTGIGPTSVEISDHPLHPGHQYEVYLSQAGRLWLESLAADLVCDEEVTYRQGTDIRRESCTVYRRPIFRRENFEIEPGRPFEQLCALEVPADIMHSFQAHQNAVSWKIIVEGKARKWPPFVRQFPVVVYPPLGQRHGP